MFKAMFTTNVPLESPIYAGERDKMNISSLKFQCQGPSN